MSREIDVEIAGANSQPFIPRPPSNERGLNKYQVPGCGLIIAFVILAWALEIIDLLPFVNLDLFGIHPHKPLGLIGVLTMPWLHGGFPHLISNTMTFVVLGYIIVATEKQRFYYTSFMIILFSGIGTWLIGEKGSVHIGASALIYGYFGYLVTRAFLEKRLIWIILGIALIVFYGGLIFGVFPSDDSISWEGHLMGFIAGIWMAFRNFKKRLHSSLHKIS